MPFEPFRRSDRILIATALCLIAAAAVFVLRNYEAAFPQASLSLRYSKAEITQQASDFLKQLGLTTEGFRNLTLFDPDTSARLFLEREVGLEEANRLMEAEVAVWRWRARWFRPPDQEELIAYLSPDGRLVGFRHVIPEAQPAARLEKEAARSLAERFLRAHTGAPHRLVEEQLQERPERYDYVFTWEREDFKVKDATYRRTLVVQGSEVGRYSEYLHVPERWEREYSALRSSNELYTMIAQAFYVLLILAAIAEAIRSLRRRQIRWKPLMILCGAAAALAVLNEWNLLPFYIDSMPTSSRYREMIVLGVLQGLGAGVGYFFYIVLGAAPGEPLYRQSQPERLNLAHAFRLPGSETREFFRATVAGYGFTAIHLVFLISFYLIGNRLGVWSPQDVGYSDVLSTAAPWLYPMTIGVLASTSEEFWFRLLAIPLLKRYLRSTWLAILIPAFIWGFLHANYPQQPGFIRGIEVGLIGVGAGWLFLRFGIGATLIWHYTIDALLVSTILFESSSWYLWTAGIVVSGAALIPIARSLVKYQRNGGFLVAEELLNQAAPAPPSPGPAEIPEPKEPVRASWPARYLYGAAALALIGALLVKPVQYGDFIRVNVSPVEARATAAEALRQRGVDPEAWRSVTTFLPNLDTAEFEYLRRTAGPGEANRIVGERTFHGVWLTRFIRPMQTEEWRVYVNQDGRAYRVDHILEETAPGANLSAAEGRALAEDHLRTEQQIPIDHYRAMDSSSNQREKRTDHEFVWQDPEFASAEAEARVSLSVRGDEVANFRKFLKLPEEWLRQFSRPRLREYIVPALSGAIGVPLLIILVRRLSRSGSAGHRFHWRAYALAGAVAATVTLSGSANQWANVLASYNTAEPLENHLTQWVLRRLILIAVSALGGAFVILAADAFLQLALGDRRATQPSILRCLALTALLGGAYRILEAVESIVPGDRYSLPLWNLAGADAAVPAITVIAQSLLAAIFALPPLIVAVSGAWRFLRNRRGVALCVALFALAALGRSASVWQWLFYFLEAGLLAALIVLVVRTCGLDLAGFGVAIFWLTAISLSVPLIEQPAAALRWNGAAAVLLCALAGLAILWRTGRSSRPASVLPG